MRCSDRTDRPRRPTVGGGHLDNIDYIMYCGANELKALIYVHPTAHPLRRRTIVNAC